MTQKTSPWTFDVRVRERNLKAGSLSDKDVEKYLSQLPDLADQSEPFATAQPALEQPEIADEGLDDEEDDLDDEGGADEAEAAPNANGAPDFGGGDTGGGGGGGEGTGGI